MNILVPNQIFDLLMISMTFSIILMAFIQKVKTLSIIKNNTHVMIINFIFSFLSIPFAIYFYDLNVFDGLWIALFSFIGAPAIYELLKKQNVINYTPKSLNECRGCVTVSEENVIKREDGVK